MADLRLEYYRDGHPKRLLLETRGPQERRLALSVVGALPQESDPDHISYPMEPMVVNDLSAALGERVAFSEDVRTWRKAYQDTAKFSVMLSGATDMPLPDIPWADKMYPYQRVGAAWLRNVQRGILGDDPGLGKTLQSLTAVAKDKRVMIVTLNTVKQHWARHVREWLGRDVAVCEGVRVERQAVLNERPDWVIVNHEMLRQGNQRYDHLVERKWDAMIVDEAHKLQGRDSAQSKGAALVESQKLYLLTGTPIWNQPDSLWRILNLLDPKRFSSYWRFVGEYCEVEQTQWGLDIIGFRADTLERLRSIVAPMLIRRRKEDVLPDLPNKWRVTIEYDMDKEQQKVYRDMKKRLRLVDADGSLVRVYDSALTVLSDLRMLLNSPALLGLKLGPSPKDAVIDDLVDTLLNDTHRKIIVFVWHKAYANYLSDRLKAYGTALVTGDTPRRDMVLQGFRSDPEKRILVATIGAAGTGIDLVEATAAIFAEGSHVPTLNAQAEDRLHRIGQKTDVTIYRLSARRSVEATIWQVSDDRQDQNDELLAMQEVIARVLASDEG